MSLSVLKKGPFTFYSIETGRFSLDGGAMFGVVPKTLWSRKIKADELNRIPMKMRCLLVESETTGNLYLIDNGAGDKFDEKMSEIYGIDYHDGDLHSSLQNHGFSVDDVTDVVFSHLHFDHCGGSTTFNESGDPELVFKNARHWVTKAQWVNATNANPREKASFLKENIEPLRRSGKMKLIDPGYTFETGFTFETVNGHTKGQLLPCFDVRDFKMVFCADLIPTYAHVPLPWVMGYDLFPVDTMDEKQRLLPKWADEGRYLFLEHDAHYEVITLKNDNGKVKVNKHLKLSKLD